MGLKATALTRDTSRDRALPAFLVVEPGKASKVVVVVVRVLSPHPFHFLHHALVVAIILIVSPMRHAELGHQHLLLDLVAADEAPGPAR